jgi:cytochrome c peroxidase
MKRLMIPPAVMLFVATLCVSFANVSASQFPGAGETAAFQEGRRLFERETFGGNGRTCATCHSKDTGTLSPEEAQRRFQSNPGDPLFLHDGSDDGSGHGVTRLLERATVLVSIPLPSNVTLADDPAARHVVLRRGVATTINTPALDSVLMLDGRQPNLTTQAMGAIADHAQGVATAAQLNLIATFQLSNRFFSSTALDSYSRGGLAPALPRGNTPSEKRGRRFFEDVGPDPTAGLKPGLCAHCHSGPLLNQTNPFASAFIGGLPIPAGQRFLSVGVSEFNVMVNRVREFIFDQGTANEFHLLSPDPGRALITGIGNPAMDPTLANVNAFKISPLRGVRHTAPYFHDNSALTLEDVAAHYANFFFVVTGGFIQLTEQDQRDMVAFMKLLD